MQERKGPERNSCQNQEGKAGGERNFKPVMIASCDCTPGDQHDLPPMKLVG